MIRSMTGYGRVQQTVDGLNILFEIKSVNHRFFDFNARIPRVYGFIEDKLKPYLQNYITRGKVEVFMTIDPINGDDSLVRLNETLAKSYIDALTKLKTDFNLAGDVTLTAVARNNDIFTVIKAPDDEARIWNAVKTVVDKAVEGFVSMRETEGAKLSDDLLTRVDIIKGLVKKVEERSPKTVEEYRAKLTARMQEILKDAAVDENRILLEAAVYADKVNVTEETVRLGSHIEQFKKMLSGSEAVGRKLDFLMQEMNREANTIGSKVSDYELASIVVEIKAELEKIREQIQNLE